MNTFSVVAFVSDSKWQVWFFDNIFYWLMFVFAAMAVILWFFLERGVMKFYRGHIHIRLADGTTVGGYLSLDHYVIGRLVRCDEEMQPRNEEPFDVGRLTTDGQLYFGAFAIMLRGPDSVVTRLQGEDAFILFSRTPVDPREYPMFFSEHSSEEKREATV